MTGALHARDIVCSRISADNQSLSIGSLSFACDPGSLNLLLGPGGGGNRLFLRILGLLERPDSGEVFLQDSPTAHLAASELAELRSHRFGYVFPEPYLLPSLSVFENVAMPLFKISEVNIEDARQMTSAALEFVGLTDCQEPVAGELPLFDQHRVSLARALVNQPDFLILENLDATLSESEMIGLIRLVRTASTRFGIAAIFSGTNSQLSARMDSVLEMNPPERQASVEPESNHAENNLSAD